MPRSKAQIRSDNAARVRCRELIKDVVATFRGKKDAVSIVQRIQFNHGRRVTEDVTMLAYLWGKGLQAEVRAALALWDEVETPEAAAPQLELFPAHERALVRQIGRARIWLPSEQEHVAYHEMDPDPLDEAGEYYIAHGYGEVRLGENLKLLAAMRRAPQSEAA
jgi:hypothetical protein